MSPQCRMNKNMSHHLLVMEYSRSNLVLTANQEAGNRSTDTLSLPPSIRGLFKANTQVMGNIDRLRVQVPLMTFFFSW
jgi:hypothetical protein